MLESIFDLKFIQRLMNECEMDRSFDFGWVEKWNVLYIWDWYPIDFNFKFGYSVTVSDKGNIFFVFFIVSFIVTVWPA